MQRTAVLFCLFLFIIAYGCSVPVTTEVESGRTALIAGNPETALSHFQRGAKAQPDYIADLPPLREGIWTYVGRAYYDLGKFAEAREALAQALKHDDGDFMARLYLGLALFQGKAPSSPPDKSFALTDILYALKESVAPKRVAALVKERGVHFNLTAEAERELRKSGADEELIEQVRNSAKLRAQFEESPAQQGLKQTERALRDIHSWEKRIKGTDYGRFWDARKRIRLQVETSLEMIDAKKTNRQEFVSGLEWIGRAIEEEVDLSRRDKLEYEKKNAGRPG